MVKKIIITYKDEMQLEGISGNKIKCTITKKLLKSHNLKISELANGTENAKNFFKTIMIRAENDLCFSGEKIPLIIEAEPVDANSIALLISKVNNEKELESRFTKVSYHD